MTSDPPPPECELAALGELGSRARPLTGPLREAALIIGLGQVGLRAVGRLHAMLSATLPPPVLRDQVRLLAIARRRAQRDDVPLPRDARLLLSIDPLPWSEVPGRYAGLGLARWWPRSPRSRELLDDPTRVRAFSRLLLFENAALVNETLWRLVTWLDNAGPRQARGLVRRVYLIGSLAEPEGSGMLFDIATRLRMLPARKASTTLGVFSLRDPASDSEAARTLAMANAYAALREIDAYTLQPDAYPSDLPTTGHTLTERRGRPALDMILLADDAASLSSDPPDAPLAECVLTWIASGLGSPAASARLPQPVAHDGSADRFHGYSTFGVSKLAVPSSAAQTVVAARLAQVALDALKATHADTPTSGWALQMAEAARHTLLRLTIEAIAEIADRVRQWQFDLSAAGLIRVLESRASRGEPARMVGLVQAEWRRLERDSGGDGAPDLAGTGDGADTLRDRVGAALAAGLGELYGVLQASPADLAYGRGLGLIWVLGALDELDGLLTALLDDLQRYLAEAEAAVQLRRGALIEAAGIYDAKTGRLIGGRKDALADLEDAGRAACKAAFDRALALARLDAAHDLRARVGASREHVRQALAQVDEVRAHLAAEAAACRAALDAATGKAPRFPAGAVVTPAWLDAAESSTRELVAQPARDLLALVYGAWERDEVPPERRITRFLETIDTAARRAVAPHLTFPDLSAVLDDGAMARTFAPALHGLLTAATPALVPAADDRHSAPMPFEIVRVAPRTHHPMRLPPAGVARVTIPSPDPDGVVAIRILHGLSAESLPALRGRYRRAYERATAEGAPLHIDRRWDSTMADLVQVPARREIGALWDRLLAASARGPDATAPALHALIRLLGDALGVRDAAVVPHLPPDVQLVVFKLPPLQLKLPPPTCPMLFVFGDRPAAALSDDLYRAVASLPLEEQFVFVVNGAGRADLDQATEALRRANFTVVMLNEADMRRIVTARMPIVALSDRVLAQVRLATLSPFYTRGPVPEHMFFGREREINEVRSKLRSHSVALIGGRRIGKTSTLQCIYRLFKPRESDTVPYYLDCHGATSYRTFFWLINRRWQVPVDPEALPVQFEDVVSALHDRHPGQQLVFLFDEIDSLLEFDRKPDNHETLFRTFRSLSNEKRCQFVFSGEKWLMQATANPYSALFNFAQAMRLQPLPHRVVCHLVADPFEMLNIWLEQPERIVDRIYEISAGHPNIVQMICQAMVEELDAHPAGANLLTVEHLDRATSRRSLQEEIVQTIWGQMNALARLVTMVWPEGRRELALAEIEALLHEAGLPHVPPEQLERTAKELELYCFVRPLDGDRLQLVPVAFPAILDFMTDKRRQIEIVLRRYLADPEASGA